MDIAAHQRILVALDVTQLQDALDLVEVLRDHVGGFKVGLELCTAVGVPQVVDAISAAGGKVFLDLKLKDIPNTVSGALRAVATSCGNRVRMITLHCDGGSVMLKAAAITIRQHYPDGEAPLLLGVTVLTSLDESALNQELGISATVETQVVRLAQLAQSAGLDGVVASPKEIAAIRQACGNDLLIVTPGVRPSWASIGDQRRVMTPLEAYESGADYLVIGRPITQAPADAGGPAAAAQRIAKELEKK